MTINKPQTIGTGLEYQSSNNPMLDAYYKANPYVNQTYKQTWVDKIFGGIFRTPEEKWREEMALNAAQYNASVVDLGEQLDYNSEASKSDRMRAAGLNPDLLGIGDASSSPGLSPDVQDAQIPEAVEPLSLASSVVGNMLNIIPQSLSFLNSLQSLRGVRLANDAAELSFGQQASDAAADFFLSGITEQDYRDAFEKNDWTNIIAASQTNSKALSDTLLSSESARKRFRMMYGRYSNSLLSKMQKYQTYGDFEKARFDLLSRRSSSRFSDDDDTMSGLLSAFLGPSEHYQQALAEFNEKRTKLRNPELEQGLENRQFQNQLEYENNINPTFQAEAENESNAYVKQLNSIQKMTDDYFAEVMENLKKQDSWWSKIALSLVGIARAQLMSGFNAQFGRRSSYEVNGDTGVYSEHGQSGFNLSF